MKVVAFRQMAEQNILFEGARLKLIRLRIKVRRTFRVTQNAMLESARTRGVVAKLKSIFRRANPDDPFAMVTARKKPRLPRDGAAIAVDPHDCF